MKTRLLLSVAVLTTVVGWSGCASASRRPVYDPSQVGTVLSIGKAEVVSVRDVDIKPTTLPSSTGGPIGTVTGGAVTSVITGTPGAIGRAVGSVVGRAVGSNADVVAGEEITLSVEGGATVVIVQERSNPPLAPGEKVLILEPSTMSSIYGRGRATVSTPGSVRVVREDRYAGPISPRVEWAATRVAQASGAP